MERNSEEKLKDIFKRMSELEKEYNEMSKENLINIMVFKEMMYEAFDVDDENHETELWCYVSDNTGTMYLTNEFPKMYVEVVSPEKQILPSDIITTSPGASTVLLTDGEVNIRVPDVLRPMLPKLEYGDLPVKVKFSISF